MTSTKQKRAEEAPAAQETVREYEAPHVESVVTADDVERESLYGGISVPP